MQISRAFVQQYMGPIIDAKEKDGAYIYIDLFYSLM